MSVSGFSHMSGVVEPSPRVSELFADRLPPLGPLKKGTKRNTHEATFSCALLHPLSRLNVYKCILQSLIRCHNNLPLNESSSATAMKKLQVCNIDVLLLFCIGKELVMGRTHYLKRKRERSGSCWPSGSAHSPQWQCPHFENEPNPNRMSKFVPNRTNPYIYIPCLPSPCHQ